MKFGTLCTLTLALAAAGCSSHGDARITFRHDDPTVATAKPSKTKSIVYADFPGAYVTSGRDGAYDVVLVNDTLRAALSPGHKGPLHPVAEPPLQQAIHIHVFWRPTAGAMIRESSITNAVVHWYVFSSQGAGSADMLHYEGAAFVKLDPKGQFAELTIGQGEVKPKDVRGGLRDPVGPSQISGTAMAVRNDSRVRELLTTLQDKIAGNDRYWTEAQADPR